MASMQIRASAHRCRPVRITLQRDGYIANERKVPRDEKKPSHPTRFRLPEQLDLVRQSQQIVVEQNN